MHTCITLHYITLHYITLHYITLHYITLHYITLHYIHKCIYNIYICSTNIVRMESRCRNSKKIFSARLLRVHESCATATIRIQKEQWNPGPIGIAPQIKAITVHTVGPHHMLQSWTG